VNPPAKLGRRVVNNTTFAILDTIVTKAGTTAVFVALARLLPTEDLGTIGIAGGYIVLIAFLEVAPIRVLARDYPALARDQHRRDELLTALFAFWWLQALGMFIVWGVLSLTALRHVGGPAMTLVFLGVTMDFMALGFADWLKSIFYADFQQRFATKVTLAISVARLLCFGLLFLSPSLKAYGWLLIGTAVGSCTIWWLIFQRRFQYRPVVTPALPKLLRASLSEYGLWNYLGRMALNPLLLFDTVVLSWFSPLREIANYTIALRFNSLFFLVPQQLGRSLQLVLSYTPAREARADAINGFFKINALLSLAQFGVLALAGPRLMRLLFGQIDHAAVVYAMIIGLAVGLMNFGWPLISVVNNLCSQRRAFLQLYLPSSVVGLAIYIIAAYWRGGLGVAYANIAVYGTFLAFLVRFVAREYPFTVHRALITPAEQHILRNLMAAPVPEPASATPASLPQMPSGS
jgi:O-antigen/teichoic acid export membrane protein